MSSLSELAGKEGMTISRTYVIKLLKMQFIFFIIDGCSGKSISSIEKFSWDMGNNIVKLIYS